MTGKSPLVTADWLKDNLDNPSCESSRSASIPRSMPARTFPERSISTGTSTSSIP